MSTRRRRRGRRSTTAAAAVLAAAGLALAAIGWHAQVRAANPPPEAAHPSAEGNLSAPTVPGRSGVASTPPPTNDSRPGSDTTSRSSVAPVVGPTVDRSRPISLRIPAIGIDHAHLAAYGTNSRGAVGIPASTGHVPAGWYTGSPTPGQLGPSVIVGHIDSAADGPSIFFNLGKLRPGNKVYVTLADNVVAVFKVDSLEMYPKKHFPTAKVYGNINHAGLRLITCGGQFDSSWGHYLKNTVVYAHLVGHHGT